MADYDAGRVFLQVVPSFRGVQALISAEAQKWGTEAGKSFQDGFDRGLGRTRTNIGPSASDSRRQGSEAGGAFGDGFRRRVDAALKNLPPVKIGPVQSGTAEAKIREIRQQLERLRDQTIGVDLDASAAMSELAAVDAALKQLDGDDVDIQVRVDAAAARSQLAAIHSQVNNLDRDDVNIRVNVDTSRALSGLNTFTGRLGAVATAGIALGPALLPVLGAIGAAFAGIGLGAAAGAGGLGVLGAALSNVSDGMKLLEQRDKALASSAAQNAATRVSAANQIASAQRQLESAQRGLAQAQQRAADGAADAARRVAEAQEDAARAARDSARAVEDAARRVASAQAEVARVVRDSMREVEEAAERVVDAQERLARAVENANRAVAESARGIERAQRNVADAVEDSARSVEQALRRQSRAEENLSNAQRRAVDAQDDLNDARERARESLEDMELSARSAALAEQEAELGYERAMQRLEELRNQRVSGIEDAQEEARRAKIRLDQLVAEGAPAYNIDIETRNVARAEAELAALEDEQARLADANSLAMREAELGVERAELTRDEARERNADIQAEAEQAREAGVEGADQVVDAERSLADARLAELSALEDLRLATDDLARARVDGARRITDAEESLTEAIQNHERTRRDSAERIADAEEAVADAIADQALVRERVAEREAAARENLARAIENQERTQVDAAERIADAEEAVTLAVQAQERQRRDAGYALAGALAAVEGAEAALAQAVASGSETMSQSAQTALDEWNKLPPVLRDFITFMDQSVMPALERMRTAIQEALLPDIQRAITNLLPYEKAVTDFAVSMADVMGDILIDASEALGNDEWQRFFTTMRDVAPDALRLVAEGLGNLATAFANLIVAFTPSAMDILGWFVDLTAKFREWTRTLDENPAFQNFLDYVRDNAPLVTDFLGSLALAIGKILQALSPLGPVILVVATYLADLIANMNPDVLAMIIGFAGGLRLIGTALAALRFIKGHPLFLLAGLFVLLYSEWEPFRALVDEKIVPALKRFFDFVNDKIIPKIKELWDDVIFPIFQSIGRWIAERWEQDIYPALRDFWNFLQNDLMPKVRELWNDVVSPMFQKIGSWIKETWQNTIWPALQAFWDFLNDDLIPIIQWLWNNVVEPMFRFIGNFIKETWDRVIFPTLKAFWSFLNDQLIPIINWLWNNVVEPVFRFIGNAISTAWNSVIKPALESLWSFIDGTLIPVMQFLYNDVVKPVWENIQGAIEGAWVFLRDNVFPMFETAVRGLATVFTETKEAIGSAWSLIQSLVREPIAWVIDKVINEGIIRAYDWIAEKVGLPPLGAAELPDAAPTPYVGVYAKGGIYPGYTPGRDIGIAAVSGGEAIMRPEWTRAVGADVVHAMNRIARTRGVAGVRDFFYGGFATGGVVAPRAPGDVWSNKPKWRGGLLPSWEDIQGYDLEDLAQDITGIDVGGKAKDFVMGGLRKAAEAVINPLINLIPVGNDLGKLLKAAARKIGDGVIGLGGKHDDQFAETVDLGGGVTTKGLTAAATALAGFIESTWPATLLVSGWRKPTKDNTFSDHPKGRALDIGIPNYRSSSGIALGTDVANYLVANSGAHGVRQVIWRDRITTAGRPWKSYRHPHGRMDDTARHLDHVHVGVYDEGGRLAPGLSTVANLTGMPELVINPRQEVVISQALDVLRAYQGQFDIVRSLADVFNAQLSRFASVTDRIEQSSDNVSDLASSIKSVIARLDSARDNRMAAAVNGVDSTERIMSMQHEMIMAERLRAVYERLGDAQPLVGQLNVGDARDVQKMMRELEIQRLMYAGSR